MAAGSPSGRRWMTFLWPARCVSVMRLFLRTMVLSLPILLVGVGCASRPDVFCEGEEVDFTPVGPLAGRWVTDECACDLEFDSENRLRLFKSDYEFGCEPGQRPLVIGGVTIYYDLQSPNDIYELVQAHVEEGSITLVHQDAGPRGGYIVRKFEMVDENTLLHYSRRPRPMSLTFNRPPYLYYRSEPMSP